MKNLYLYNELKIIDLVERNTKWSKHRKMFILENGDEIKAYGLAVKIYCSECKQYFDIVFAARYEDKPYKCPHCRQIGENNSFYGRKHSDEFKQRLSMERKGVWGVGEKNSMYGKNSEDYMTPYAIIQKRQKQSISLRGEKNGMYGEQLSAHMSIENYQNMQKKQREHTYQSFSKEKQYEISEKIRNAQLKLKERDPIAYSKMKARGGIATKSKACSYTMSSPEIKLDAFLKANNVNYDYSCIMGSGEKCFQYDFIIHEKRVLIEVHGNYWHGDPNIYNEDGSDGKIKLNNIQKTKIERDKLKRDFAQEKNFKLICIWESEINNNDFSKLKDIL